MRHTLLRRARHWLNPIAYLLVTAILLYFSQQYMWQQDFSASGQGSLKPRSQDVVTKMDAQVRLSLYIEPNPEQIRKVQLLVDRYRQYKRDITLEIINIETDPDLSRKLDIRRGGELLIHYKGKEQRLQSLSELSLTQAFQRLLRRSDGRHVAFVIGHGERSVRRDANHDLSEFAHRLIQSGIKVSEIALDGEGLIPPSVQVLVIASPNEHFSAQANQTLRSFLARGGNLLWLFDPDSARLPVLEQQLKLAPAPGEIVDASSKFYSLNQAHLVLLKSYRTHPIVAEFDRPTLFAKASAIEQQPNTPWRVQTFLQSSEQSWREVSSKKSSDTRELSLGITLTRPVRGREQRIAVVGDGDFLANTWLQNGGNVALGERIVNWLVNEDALIDLGAARAADTQLHLSTSAIALIGIGFFLLLPSVFLTIAGTLYLRRRKR